MNDRRILDRESFVKVFKEQAVTHKADIKNIMVFYTIFWILENTSMYLLTETQCTQKDIQRSQKEIREVIKSILNL